MSKGSIAKTTLRRLYDSIREVPDFPRPGIVFRDITPLLLEPVLFRQVVREMAEPARALEVDKIVAVESRGFIFAAPMALDLRTGLVPAHRKGRLPWKTHQIEYVFDYGTDAIEIHQDAVRDGERILLVDDVLATGGTAEAAVEAVRRAGGEVVGTSVLLELLELDGRSKLPEIPVWSVLTYPTSL